MGKQCHCKRPAITNLDGDDLCQEHADAWVKAEGQAFNERENENPITSYADRRGH